MTYTTCLKEKGNANAPVSAETSNYLTAGEWIHQSEDWYVIYECECDFQMEYVLVFFKMPCRENRA